MREAKKIIPCQFDSYFHQEPTTTSTLKGKTLFAESFNLNSSIIATHDTHRAGLSPLHRLQEFQPRTVDRKASNITRVSPISLRTVGNWARCTSTTWVRSDMPQLSRTSWKSFRNRSSGEKNNLACPSSIVFVSKNSNQGLQKLSTNDQSRTLDWKIFLLTSEESTSCIFFSFSIYLPQQAQN